MTYLVNQTDRTKPSGVDLLVENYREERMADQENLDYCMPHRVREIIDSLHIVQFVDDSERKIYKDLKYSIDVGLRVISTPQQVLATLTSQSRIYVLYLNNETHVKFLKDMLASDKIHIFTTSGIEDADVLRSFDIMLTDRQIDLIALDAQLRLQMIVLKNDLAKRQYTLNCLIKEVKLKRLDFLQLLKKYLGVEFSRTSRRVAGSANFSELDDLAIHIIQKRAALMRELRNVMMREFDDRSSRPSHDIYSFGIHASDDMREIVEENRNYNQMCTLLNRCSIEQERISK